MQVLLYLFSISKHQNTGLIVVYLYVNTKVSTWALVLGPVGLCPMLFLIRAHVFRQVWCRDFLVYIFHLYGPSSSWFIFDTTHHRLQCYLHQSSVTSIYSHRDLISISEHFVEFIFLYHHLWLHQSRVTEILFLFLNIS